MSGGGGRINTPVKPPEELRASADKRLADGIAASEAYIKELQAKQEALAQKIIKDREDAGSSTAVTPQDLKAPIAQALEKSGLAIGSFDITAQYLLKSGNPRALKDYAANLDADVVQIESNIKAVKAQLESLSPGLKAFMDGITPDALARQIEEIKQAILSEGKGPSNEGPLAERLQALVAIQQVQTLASSLPKMQERQESLKKQAQSLRGASDASIDALLGAMTKILDGAGYSKDRSAISRQIASGEAKKLLLGEGGRGSVHSLGILLNKVNDAAKTPEDKALMAQALGWEESNSHFKQMASLLKKGQNADYFDYFRKYIQKRADDQATPGFGDLLGYSGSIPQAQEQYSDFKGIHGYDFARIFQSPQERVDGVDIKPKNREPNAEMIEFFSPAGKGKDFGYDPTLLHAEGGLFGGIKEKELISSPGFIKASKDLFMYSEGGLKIGETYDEAKFKAAWDAFRAKGGDRYLLSSIDADVNKMNISEWALDHMHSFQNQLSQAGRDFFTLQFGGKDKKYAGALLYLSSMLDHKEITWGGTGTALYYGFTDLPNLAMLIPGVNAGYVTLKAALTRAATKGAQEVVAVVAEEAVKEGVKQGVKAGTAEAVTTGVSATATGAATDAGIATTKQAAKGTIAQTLKPYRSSAVSGAAYMGVIDSVKQLAEVKAEFTDEFSLTRAALSVAEGAGFGVGMHLGMQGLGHVTGYVAGKSIKGIRNVLETRELNKINQQIEKLWDKPWNQLEPEEQIALVGELMKDKNSAKAQAYKAQHNLADADLEKHRFLMQATIAANPEKAARSGFSKDIIDEAARVVAKIEAEAKLRGLQGPVTTAKAVPDPAAIIADAAAAPGDVVSPKSVVRIPPARARGYHHPGDDPFLAAEIASAERRRGVGTRSAAGHGTGGAPVKTPLDAARTALSKATTEDAKAALLAAEADPALRLQVFMDDAAVPPAQRSGVLAHVADPNEALRLAKAHYDTLPNPDEKGRFLADLYTKRDAAKGSHASDIVHNLVSADTADGHAVSVFTEIHFMRGKPQAEQLKLLKNCLGGYDDDSMAAMLRALPSDRKEGMTVATLSELNHDVDRVAGILHAFPEAERTPLISAYYKGLGDNYVMKVGFSDALNRGGTDPSFLLLLETPTSIEALNKTRITLDDASARASTGRTGTGTAGTKPGPKATAGTASTATGSIDPAITKIMKTGSVTERAGNLGTVTDPAHRLHYFNEIPAAERVDVLAALQAGHAGPPAVTAMADAELKALAKAYHDALPPTDQAAFASELRKRGGGLSDVADHVSPVKGAAPKGPVRGDGSDLEAMSLDDFNNQGTGRKSGILRGEKVYTNADNIRSAYPELVKKFNDLPLAEQKKVLKQIQGGSTSADLPDGTSVAILADTNPLKLVTGLVENAADHKYSTKSFASSPYSSQQLFKGWYLPFKGLSFEKNFLSYAKANYFLELLKDRIQLDIPTPLQLAQLHEDALKGGLNVDKVLNTFAYRTALRKIAGDGVDLHSFNLASKTDAELKSIGPINYKPAPNSAGRAREAILALDKHIDQFRNLDPKSTNLEAEKGKIADEIIKDFLKLYTQGDADVFQLACRNAFKVRMVGGLKEVIAEKIGGSGGLLTAANPDSKGTEALVAIYVAMKRKGTVGFDDLRDEILIPKALSLHDLSNPVYRQAYYTRHGPLTPIIVGGKLMAQPFYNQKGQFSPIMGPLTTFTDTSTLGMSWMIRKLPWTGRGDNVEWAHQWKNVAATTVLGTFITTGTLAHLDDLIQPDQQSLPDWVHVVGTPVNFATGRVETGLGYGLYGLASTARGIEWGIGNLATGGNYSTYTGWALDGVTSLIPDKHSAEVKATIAKLSSRLTEATKGTDPAAALAEIEKIRTDLKNLRDTKVIPPSLSGIIFSSDNTIPAAQRKIFADQIDTLAGNKPSPEIAKSPAFIADSILNVLAPKLPATASTDIPGVLKQFTDIADKATGLRTTSSAKAFSTYVDAQLAKTVPGLWGTQKDSIIRGVKTKIAEAKQGLGSDDGGAPIDTAALLKTLKDVKVLDAKLAPILALGPQKRASNDQGTTLGSLASAFSFITPANAEPLPAAGGGDLDNMIRDLEAVTKAQNSITAEQATKRLANIRQKLALTPPAAPDEILKDLDALSKRIANSETPLDAAVAAKLQAEIAPLMQEQTDKITARNRALIAPFLANPMKADGTFDVDAAKKALPYMAEYFKVKTITIEQYKADKATLDKLAAEIGKLDDKNTTDKAQMTADLRAAVTGLNQSPGGIAFAAEIKRQQQEKAAEDARANEALRQRGVNALHKFNPFPELGGIDGKGQQAVDIGRGIYSEFTKYASPMFQKWTDPSQVGEWGSGATKGAIGSVLAYILSDVLKSSGLVENYFLRNAICLGLAVVGLNVFAGWNFITDWTKTGAFNKNSASLLDFGPVKATGVVQTGDAQTLKHLPAPGSSFTNFAAKPSKLRVAFNTAAGKGVSDDVASFTVGSGETMQQIVAKVLEVQKVSNGRVALPTAHLQVAIIQEDGSAPANIAIIDLDKAAKDLAQGPKATQSAGPLADPITMNAGALFQGQRFKNGQIINADTGISFVPTETLKTFAAPKAMTYDALLQQVAPP